MTLFHPDNRNKSDHHKRIHRAFQIGYELVSFSAAVCFVVGSAFYFYESLHSAGTWLFLIGSVLFALKPVISLARELRYAALSRQKVRGAG